MNAQEIWHSVIAELKLQMTKATFDAWISQSRAISFDGQTLIVECHSESAMAWMDTRLATTIRRSLTGIVGNGITLEYRVRNSKPTNTSGNSRRPSEQTEHSELTPDEANSAVDVVALYLDKRNEIVKPHRAQPVSDYLIKNWMHRLGPVLTAFVIILRQHGYWNRKTDEKRETFKWTLTDAAGAMGISVDTLARHIRKMMCDECGKHHPIIEHFVPVMRKRYDFSETMGKRICTGTSFKVYMDDPLTPKDERTLKQELSTLSTAPKPQLAE